MTTSYRTRTGYLAALLGLVALILAGATWIAGVRPGQRRRLRACGNRSSGRHHPTDPALLVATPTQAAPGAPNTGQATPTPFTLSPVPGGQTVRSLEMLRHPVEPLACRPRRTPIRWAASGSSNFDAPSGAWISGSDEIVARGVEGGIYYVGVQSSEGLLWGYTLGPKAATRRRATS